MNQKYIVTLSPHEQKQIREIATSKKPLKQLKIGQTSFCLPITAPANQWPKKKCLCSVA